MNLLDRAKKLLQGQGGPVTRKTQYYNVLCPDGHRMSGERNEGYQALRCPSCGEGVFILPRSPLPEVAAPPRPAVSTSRRAAVEAAVLDEPIALTDPPPMPPPAESEELAEIEWEDSPSPPAPNNAAPATVEAPLPSTQRRKVTAAEGPGPSARRATNPGPARERAQPRAAAPKPPRVPEPQSPPFDVRDWAQRRRNPLIFTGVALVVVLTAGLRQWRSQLQDYPRQAEIGRTEGLQALDAGEWDRAHQLLSRAKRAVDALGGKVEGADEIRHAADEAAIYANLLADGLESLLRQADPDETSSWPRDFDTLYKRKAIVVTANVIAVPGENGASEYELDYLVLPTGEGNLDSRDIRRGRIDLSNFRLVHDIQPKIGTHLEFGARLRSFTFDSEHSVWLVGLEPDSGVNLLNKKALQAALLTKDSETPAEEGKP